VQLDDNGHVISGDLDLILNPHTNAGTFLNFVASGLADALTQLNVDLRNSQGHVLTIGLVFPLLSHGGSGAWTGATITGQAVVVPSTSVPAALFSLRFTITLQPTSGVAVQVSTTQDFGPVDLLQPVGSSGDCS